MTKQRPRFDQPCYTVSADVVLRDENLDQLLATKPLPTLHEPQQPPVVAPVDEPMVLVEHRRIRTMANYWHAGWPSALATTWMRAKAFERLCQAVESLPEPWGLAVFDAWRPLALQQELYEAAVADSSIEAGFMARPSDDPATPPSHLTGGAVDLTLTWHGIALGAGTGFDDTTNRAFVEHFEQTPGAARHIRRALFHLMCDHGFVIYKGEWWHFEYGTMRWAAVTGGTAHYGPTEPPTH